MNSIIIYNSQTGFTKKYADWISEAAGCDCVEFKKGSKSNLSGYDTIVFGGWFMAGTITNLKWFKKQIAPLAQEGKKLIVFCVGATPAESPDISEVIKRNFTQEELSKVKVFYCPGGLDYSKMNFLSKFAMKMLLKSLTSKKNPTEAEIAQAKLISSSYDLSNKKYIEPIVAELK